MSVRGIGGPKGPSGRGPQPLQHRVQEGETLSSIASSHRIDRQALVSANPHLRGAEVKTGQTVDIPGGSPPGSPAETKGTGDRLHGADRFETAARPGLFSTSTRASEGPSGAAKSGEALAYKVSPSEAEALRKSPGKSISVKLRPGIALSSKVLARLAPGEALANKAAPGEALAYKVDVGEALAYKAGAGIASSIHMRPGEDLAQKVAPGDASVHKLGAGAASHSIGIGETPPGKTRPGEAAFAKSGADAAIEGGEAQVLSLSPEQFDITPDGELLVKDREVVEALREALETTGARSLSEVGIIVIEN